MTDTVVIRCHYT